MDLSMQFGIMSGFMGLLIFFFTYKFLWIPNNEISAMVKMAQNKGKMKAFIALFVIIVLVWLVVLIKLLSEFFS